ncbi:MAG: M23 family metallopeptidase [Desulfobacteraceae bacterium]|nr:M23 family metallopeptidase [Desulfobacteraceae bacterium]
MMKPGLKFLIVFALFVCLSWFSVSSFYKKDVLSRSNFISSGQAASSDVIQTDSLSARLDKIGHTYTTETLTETLKEGDSFQSLISRVFAKRDIGDELAEHITKKLSKLVNFRKLQPGDILSMSMDYAGRLIKCTYDRGPFESYTVEAGRDGGYKVYKDYVTLERRVVRLDGVINDSLFSAFSRIGEEPRLAIAFADIFASQLDFNTESMPGDRFNLIVEKYYKHGVFIGYGRILAARYEGASKNLEAFFFRTNDSSGGKYFDQKGSELGTAFLRSPLPVFRVTSRFTRNRLDPILGVERPHLGVDLAAPIGTPVMAAADGRVKFAGWENGFGKTVLLQHSGGLETQYAHLSRFGYGVKVGARVKQKQIIGYVGVSGMSTGPHLDYRISENGVFKNPFSLKFRPKSMLAGAKLRLFEAQSAKWMAFLTHDKTRQVLMVEQRKVQGPPDGWLG